jgi:crotonobetaine/carnitine-CoA ligase
MPTPWETLSCYPAHDGTLAGLLASRGARDGDRPFLLFEDRTWSWHDFRAIVEKAAAALARRGVAKGARVAVMAPNSDAYAILFFALARLGAVMVPVNPELGVAEGRYILAHADVSAVAVVPATVAVAREACDGKPWFFDLDGELLELARAAPGAPPAADVAPGDTCLIMYTSGTTGFPKGVMHSQRNFVLAGEGFVERMHLTPEDRLLCILPLYHINALFYSLGGTVAAGASLVLAPRFSASGFWPLAAKTGATEVNIIAAVGGILARRPRSELVPHRLVKVYGAPIAPEVADAFQKEFRVPTVIEGYGMTEVPGACNIPFLGPHKIGSMGKPALHPDRRIPFAELRVVDADDGRDLADGETGELLVRTPIVMQGYYRDPEATAAAFRDGWFATGDLVRREADGFFTFVARKKDIIRRRGENIAGAELDRVIGLHPGVAEAAAIAVPSELGEDEILVVVVPRPGAAVTAADIGAWCAQRLTASKVPRYVAFASELPHTPTHRVAKFKLKGDAGLLGRAVDLQEKT